MLVLLVYFLLFIKKPLNIFLQITIHKQLNLISYILMELLEEIYY